MGTLSAVVLAAGKGTRMKSRVPKVLHRVCGRAMVALVVEAARDAGVDSAVVVVAPDSRGIRDVLGDGVAYAVQSEQLGSGHALLQARPLLEDADNVVVLSGDVPLIRPETVRALVRLHLDSHASITLSTATPEVSDGFGRIVRDESGSVSAVVEDSEADEATREITEINGGVYCFDASWLWPNLAALAPSSGGEVFLTDLVAAASQQGMSVRSLRAERHHELLGVNTRVQLAEAEAVLRRQIRERWMLSGVTMPDPDTVYIDLDAELGQDSVVHPNTHVTGSTRIGAGCELGPNTAIDSSVIGPESRVEAAVVRGSTLEDSVVVGPFSHIRPGTYLESGVRVGSSAEIKASRLGRGTRCGHFSYIGDATIGANVNIGAGTVTCNFDGTDEKKRTIIGDDAFIGSDSMLVAPVTIGARAETGAGTVVTRDVPPDTLVFGVPARIRPRKRWPGGEVAVPEGAEPLPERFRGAVTPPSVDAT